MPKTPIKIKLLDLTKFLMVFVLILTYTHGPLFSFTALVKFTQMYFALLKTPCTIWS